MSEAANGEPQHRRPHSKPAAGPYLELDLTRELEELHRLRRSLLPTGSSNSAWHRDAAIGALVMPRMWTPQDTLRRHSPGSWRSLTDPTGSTC